MSQRSCIHSEQTQVADKKVARSLPANAEWSSYGDLIESCANMFVAHADVTVCTIAQLANEGSKNVKFDWIIVDEASKITEAQLVKIRRLTIEFLLIFVDHVSRCHREL